MSTGSAVTSATPTENPPKWLGEPITKVIGTPEGTRALLPRFDRRPFGLKYPTGGQMPLLKPTGVNDFWDMIVRMPLSDEEAETPVGIVSKTYKLIQHRELFDQAAEAISGAEIKLGEVNVELTLTTYGGRMGLKFILPERFAFNPGNTELKMSLIFECFNSVEGSSRLIVTLGWLRLVCMNGLMVGTSRLSQRFIHTEFVEIPDLGLIFREGVLAAKAEIGSYSQWLKMQIEEDLLIEWIDNTVKEQWGPLAAARAYSICTTGWDGKFVDPFEKARPHAKAIEKTRSVPGSLIARDSAYSVSQALAWIAKERRDIQEQLNWMRDIPELMGKLLSEKLVQQ